MIFGSVSVFYMVEESTQFHYDLVVAVASTNEDKVLEILNSVLAYVSTL